MVTHTLAIPLRFQWKGAKLTLSYFFQHERVFAWARHFRRFGKSPSYSDPKTQQELQRIRDWFLRQSLAPAHFQSPILVEAFFSDPTSNFNSLLTYQLLRHFSTATQPSYVLLQQPNESVGSFWENVGNFKPLYFSHELSLKLRLDALKVALREFRKVKLGKYGSVRCEIDGTDLGELVTEDIIRRLGIPTLLRKGPVLFAAMYNACLRFQVYRALLQKHSIGHVVATHNVYINFGTLLRAASGQADFWLWGGSEYFLLHRTKASGKDQLRPSYLSRQDLDLVLAQGRDWVEAEYRQLVEREFSGTYVKNFDDITVYRSAGIKDAEDFKKEFAGYYDPKRKNVFVMSHVLVDSVNSSPWRIFSDYYNWLFETLETLAQNPHCNIFLKPHPSDSYYGSLFTSWDIAEAINQNYPGRICFIGTKVSNELIYKVAHAFVTSTGSVSAQAPCFGIPTITAGGIATAVAAATYTAKTPEEYRKLLLSAHELPPLSSEKVLAARAAYLWYSKLSFVKTGLNQRFDNGTSPLAIFCALRELLEQQKSMDEDLLVKNFRESFVLRNEQELLNFMALREAPKTAPEKSL